MNFASDIAAAVDETSASSFGVVCHIPHSSAVIPTDVRRTLLLSDGELERELRAMTDWYTDEVFALPADVATTVRYPVSRLVVDPERFVDDAAEPMAARGMGVIYTRTSTGQPLRRQLSREQREELLVRYYEPHHARLTHIVQSTLADHGGALVLDCHSFPSSPLPCDLDQRPDRPEICLGTDRFHTPAWLVELAERSFVRNGFAVAIDRPYGGALVPSAYFGREAAVRALMIEVNRRLYLHEATAAKRSSFCNVADRVRESILGMVRDARQIVAQHAEIEEPRHVGTP